jgi:hypothetical protein
VVTFNAWSRIKKEKGKELEIEIRPGAQNCIYQSLLLM